MAVDTPDYEYLIQREGKSLRIYKTWANVLKAIEDHKEWRIIAIYKLERVKVSIEKSSGSKIDYTNRG